MKLNWAERLAVNNPARIWEQRLELRWILPRISLRPGFVGLEIGCGRGAGAALILERLRPRRLLALDLDPVMLRKATSRLASAGHANAELLVGDAEQLPLRANSIDGVFGFGVLHHLPNWRAALTEIRRVLRPLGTYVLEELYPSLYQNLLTRHVLLHPTEDRFRSADLRRALEDIGLPVIRSVEIRGVGVLAICSRTE